MVSHKFSLSNYINPLAFIIAFSIGILFTYILKPKPTIIIKYPTPDNYNENIYQDLEKNCYKYKPISVECPNDPTKITVTKNSNTIDNQYNIINQMKSFLN